MAERRRWEAATETMPLRHCPLAAATTESQQLLGCCSCTGSTAATRGLTVALRRQIIAASGGECACPAALPRPRWVTRMILLPCLTTSLLACYATVRPLVVVA